MVVKVGDRFFNPESNEMYLVTAVGHSFLTWKAWFREEWILVMNPVRLEELERQVLRREILLDTPANRILYAKN